MQINETNCPTLRYIKWQKPLFQHPEFAKALQKKGRDYFITAKGLPYLHTNYHNTQVNTIIEKCVNIWGELSKLFRLDVWTASLQYGKAFEEATGTICEHRYELYKQMTGKPYAGTYIQATADLPLCLLYQMYLNDVRKETREDGQEGLRIIWDGYILMVSGKDLVAAAWSSSHGDILYAGAHPHLQEVFEQANGSVDAALVFEVLDNQIFRNYADVVVKYVKGKDKPQHGTGGDNELTVRTTLNNVKTYDVNWFTETVRTEGFARRGYMGLRWKGPLGNRRLELVPVRPAWVKGYTRKARKPKTDKTLKDYK